MPGHVTAQSQQTVIGDTPSCQSVHDRLNLILPVERGNGAASLGSVCDLVMRAPWIGSQNNLCRSSIVMVMDPVGNQNLKMFGSHLWRRATIKGRSQTIWPRQGPTSNLTTWKNA